VRREENNKLSAIQIV